MTALDSPDAPAALAGCQPIGHDWVDCAAVPAVRAVRTVPQPKFRTAQARSGSGERSSWAPLTNRGAVSLPGTASNEANDEPGHGVARAFPGPFGELTATQLVPRGTRRRTGVCACTGVREPIE